MARVGLGGTVSAAVAPIYRPTHRITPSITQACLSAPTRLILRKRGALSRRMAAHSRTKGQSFETDLNGPPQDEVEGAARV